MSSYWTSKYTLNVWRKLVAILHIKINRFDLYILVFEGSKNLKTAFDKQDLFGQIQYRQ